MSGGSPDQFSSSSSQDDLDFVPFYSLGGLAAWVGAAAAGLPANIRPSTRCQQRVSFSLAAIRVFLVVVRIFIIIIFLQSGDCRVPEKGFGWKGPVLGFSIKNSLNVATTRNGAPWKSFSRANILEGMSIFLRESRRNLQNVWTGCTPSLFTRYHPVNKEPPPSPAAISKSCGSFRV